MALCIQKMLSEVINMTNNDMKAKRAENQHRLPYGVSRSKPSSNDSFPSNPLQLAAKEIHSGHVELHSSSQAGDSLSVSSEDISLDVIGALRAELASLGPRHLHTRASQNTYGRNLFGQLNSLGDDPIAGFDGTFQINFPHLLTQIGFGLEKSDKPILDSQIDIRALFNGLLDGSLCLYDEILATRVEENKPVSIVIRHRIANHHLTKA